MRKILILGLGLVFGAYAEDYAVVVGIDKYKQDGIKHLTGAKNDALAYKDILNRNGIKESNIKFLDNEKATKISIKNALKWVVEHIKNGDRFYYFYAGYGTSLSNNQIDTLLPYDYKGGDIDSLIIPQNDFQPYFKKIDKKVSVGVVIFDASLKEFSDKGVNSSIRKNSLISRHIPSIVGELDIKNSTIYPYKNIYTITSSNNNYHSYEDQEQKRGLFTMALEGCILESQKSYQNSLKRCLDRRYLKETYTFKPLNSTNSIFFNIKDIKPNTQLTILSNLKNAMKFSTHANFITQGVYDLELISDDSGLFRLYKIYQNGDMIGNFIDENGLRRYLFNYRVIHQKGQNGSDIDIKVYYKGDNSKKDNDYIKINSNILIDIKSSKKDYYLAVFILNNKGELTMIEPINGYKKVKDYINIEINSGKLIGTDFIKVLLFKNKNGLDKLKVDGSRLNDQKEIDTILNICNKNKFYEASKAIRIIK